MPAASAPPPTFHATESRRAALTACALLAAAVHAGALFAIGSPSAPRIVRAEKLELALVGPTAAAVAPTTSPMTGSPQPPAPAIAPAPKLHAPATTPRKVESRVARVAPAIQPMTPEAAPTADSPTPAVAATISGATGGAVAATSSAPHVATSARPRYKTNPEPSYPAVARRRRQEGTVLLSVRVDASGRPDAVEIRASSGFAALDEVAVEAVRKWEFEPGRLDGAPVASRVEVPIRFQLDRE